MPAGDVETYHSDGKWKNRIEAVQELPGEYDTKDGSLAPSADSTATSTHPSHLAAELIPG
jgi:hypothetical protein